MKKDLHRPAAGHTAGHNDLYSEEALDMYRSHLTPNGMLRDMDPWLEYYFLALPTKGRIKVDPGVKADFESRIR
ncbi:MAG TPA: hypothetical protein VFS61_10950 [Anaerolineales bacterium]|nr:hypothetical protein [Anaerolineales bacterium]